MNVIHHTCEQFSDEAVNHCHVQHDFSFKFMLGIVANKYINLTVTSLRSVRTWTLLSKMSNESVSVYVFKNILQCFPSDKVTIVIMCAAKKAKVTECIMCSK